MNGRRRFDDRTDDQKVSDALDRLTDRAFGAEAKLKLIRQRVDLGQSQVRELLDAETDERGTYSHSAAMRMNIRYAETLTAIRTILDR
ncbi:MAG TPA: hypothetical protein VIT65_05050 [Microlunatus sp.]